MRKIVFSFFLIITLGSFKGVYHESPEILKTIHFGIFGDAHAATTIIDNKLAGQVYYIVGGHGGPDPGAVAKVDGKLLAEDEYAYDVSLRLAKNLITHGAKVYLIVRDENDGIRETEYLEMDKDEVVWGGEAIPRNQSERLRQRTRIINELYRENDKKGYKTQRVIETHVDSRETEHKVDIYFYFNKDKEESKRLAQQMYDTVKAKYENKQEGRGYSGVVKSRNLWMIDQSIPPIVFVELGNITNEYDRKRLLIPDNRQAIANWFAQGLIDN